jgi:5-methyltetrahydrofolate--homocysteine methyltransferase
MSVEELMDKKKILNREDTIRYLGYRGSIPDENMLYEIACCEEEFIKVVEPKYYYQVFDLMLTNDRLMTADGEFELVGKAIRGHLLGCEKVAFCCATLSERVDELIDKAQAQGEMLHALIYDAIANAAIEEVRFISERELAKEYTDYKINWQFGIGYGDLPLSLQPKFLEKIDAKRCIGIVASEHYLLTPLKSISGFIGLSRHRTEELDCQQPECNACGLNSSCAYQK